MIKKLTVNPKALQVMISYIVNSAAYDCIPDDAGTFFTIKPPDSKAPTFAGFIWCRMPGIGDGKILEVLLIEHVCPYLM